LLLVISLYFADQEKNTRWSVRRSADYRGLYMQPPA